MISNGGGWPVEELKGRRDWSLDSLASGEMSRADEHAFVLAIQPAVSL